MEWLPCLCDKGFESGFYSLSNCQLVAMNSVVTWSRGYKTFFMIISAECKIYSAHECQNANNCWHFNIYEHDISLALML